MRLWRWLILVLGVWQLSSTYALHVSDPLVVEASVLIGFLLVLAGIVANFVPDRWPTYLTGLFGLGLVALPFIHTSPATVEFLVVGALTCLASLAEFINRQHA